VCAFSLQSNAIVTSNFTDTVGRTVYKFVNANGNYNYATGINYFINFEKLGMNLNAGLDFYKSNYNNVVNDKKSVTNNTAMGVNLGINKGKEKTYNFYYQGNIHFIKTANAGEGKNRDQLKNTSPVLPVFRLVRVQ
jgi:hypothetical protein